jgi:hypothetical protein
VERAISGTSMNRDMNVGIVHSSGKPPIRQQSIKGFHGSKRPMDAREVRPFYKGPIRGVLPENLHPLYLVDRMLMKTATFPKEGI